MLIALSDPKSQVSERLTGNPRLFLREEKEIRDAYSLYVHTFMYLCVCERLAVDREKRGMEGEGAFANERLTE